MFNYTVLLYHVTWPDDYLIYDVVTLYSTHLTLICLYLTLDPWHLISDTGTWYVITWHLIPDTWYMTFDNWHAITHLTCFHMALVHLTWCCDTWLDYYYTCIIMAIHDYHFYGDLAWLLYCYQIYSTPELLCSWTPVFLNPCNRETPYIILLLIPVIG